MTKSPNLIPLSRWTPRLFCALAVVVPFALYAGPMEKNPVVENLQRPFDWTGFYIGGNIGGALGETEFRGTGGDTEGHLFSDVNLTQQFPESLPVEDTFFRFIDQTDKERDTGILHDRRDREDFIGSVIGGGQIGYQHQFGHFVAGIEGDFDRASLRLTRTFRDFTPDPVVIFEDGTTITADSQFTGRRTAEINWQGSVRGKLGYATGPLLFYATGGVTFAQMDVWAHDVVNTLFTETQNAPQGPNAPSQFPNSQFHVVNSEIDRDDEVLFGWTAGAGLEVAFNDAVSLALEYRHNDYGDESFHFGGNGTQNHGPIFPGGTRVDFSSDQVTVKMNILLNHLFGNGGGMASRTPATNSVALKSPFGGPNDNVRVGYTKAADADKWSANEITKVEEPFTWTGFYIGGNVGGAWTDYDFSHYDTEVDVGTLFLVNAPSSAPGEPQAPSGMGSVFTSFHTPGIRGGSQESLTGGGQAGYQHQFGAFVVGVEGDFNGVSSSKQTDFASFSLEPDVGGFIAFSNLFSERKATQDWIGSGRLKLGYARGPVMLYVTGGGAWSQVRTWATDRDVTEFLLFTDGTGNAPSGTPTVSGSTSNSTNDEDVVFGWTAGGGAEWAFSKIASLGLEYRHTEFDDVSSHYDPHHSLIFARGNNVDIDTDQVTVRVNFLLGHMGPGH